MVASSAPTSTGAPADEGDRIAAEEPSPVADHRLRGEAVDVEEITSAAQETGSRHEDELPRDAADYCGLGNLEVEEDPEHLLKGPHDRPDPSMILVDSGLAAILVVVGDSAGFLGWVAMAVPVLEALVWSGVIAGTLTWVAVGGTYVVLRVMLGDDIDPVLVDLVRHLGGSSLVAVPAWAAGTVIGREIESAHRTREMAQAHAENVERLARVGRDLSTMSSTDGVLDALVAAGVTLGFTAADVVVEREGVPQTVRLAGSFDHGVPRVTLLTDEALKSGAAATSPSDDAQALHRCGLRSGVAACVTRKDARIIVRLWRADDAPPGLDDRETVETVSAQAAIAWHQALTRKELEERAEALAREATHDPLTDLPNRSGLLAHLDGVAYEMSGQLALLFVDLDGFKAVNDTLGHDVGDEVLRTTAHRLRTVVGGGCVARLGGDEFVIAVGVDSIETAAMIGDRIVRAIEAQMETAAGAQLSASVGVVVVEAGANVHDMMRSADQAMYAAKRAGGGRVAAFRAGVEIA